MGTFIPVGHARSSPLAAVVVNRSRAADHSSAAVHGRHVGTVVGAILSRWDTSVSSHAPIGISWTHAVSHSLSAINCCDKRTCHWALLAIGNTRISRFTAHPIHPSGAVHHGCSTIHRGNVWTIEGTLLFVKNTSVCGHTPVGVHRRSWTVPHVWSAIGWLGVWAVHRAFLSIGNTDIR